MIEVTLYTREGCHLCDETKEILSSLQKEFPHQLALVDIDDDPLKAEEYANVIPVVEVDNLVLKAPISREELKIALMASEFRRETKEKHAQGIDMSQQEKKINLSVYEFPPPKWSRADSISSWFANHYLALVNFFIILFVGFPFLAPVFMKAGWTLPASMIYRIYGVTCHQLAYRSFFLFGEQLVYPRQAAGLENVVSYGQATNFGEGNNPQDVLVARNFIGDERIGYKIAICQRDIAIYLGILIFNFLFVLSRRKIKPLHWVVWILIAIVPIALDGVSQLISQPPLSLLPFRESTPLLRTITGFLFGFATAWLGIPHVESSMKETREIYEQKKRQDITPISR